MRICMRESVCDACIRCIPIPVHRCTCRDWQRRADISFYCSPLCSSETGSLTGPSVGWLVASPSELARSDSHRAGITGPHIHAQSSMWILLRSSCWHSKCSPLCSRLSSPTRGSLYLCRGSGSVLCLLSSRSRICIYLCFLSPHQLNCYGYDGLFKANRNTL